MSENAASNVSYRDQSDAVRARFDRLKARDVVLEVKGLGKVYDSHQGPVTALKGVDFKVHRREFVCVLGPSGCGKSTLIRILAGLESYSSGEVLLDGEPVQGPCKDRGMVFQGYTLFPWLTVKKNVMFGLEVNGAGRNEAESQARQWLELVGLTKFADAYPHQLSGGMKQRVAIARVLANDAELVLMDEPFGALDAMTRERLQDELLDIWQRTKLTVVFVTHSVEEAIVLANRVVVMTPGPGRIESDNSLGLPRPRDVSSPEFNDIRRVLGAKLHSHHAKKAA